MAIHIICPGCHARFKVGDQFAGRTGPCPKCKTKIRIPTKKEEVVIKGAEEFEGAQDGAGRLVLKPIERTETKFSVIWTIAIVTVTVVVFAIAMFIRMSQSADQISHVLLALGAVVVAPPLVLGGYTFLRDSELEPHRGMILIFRIGICSILYALTWAGYSLVIQLLLDTQPVVWNLVFLLPPFLVVGATTSFASLDLDPTSAFFHYALYLSVTVLLRMTVGLSAF